MQKHSICYVIILVIINANIDEFKLMHWWCGTQASSRRAAWFDIEDGGWKESIKERESTIAAEAEGRE